MYFCRARRRGRAPKLRSLQVFKWAKGDLEDDKIEGYADEPANSDENDQRDRRCQSLVRIVEIRGKPGPACSTNKDNQTIGEKHLIEYWQAQQRPEYYGHVTFMQAGISMDHTVVHFAGV